MFLSVQTALDEVASYGERIKKWVSPAPGTGSAPFGVDFKSHPSAFLLYISDSEMTY